MTLLWTLLTTFFVDDGPSVPEPATSGAITVHGEFAKDDSFNLPRLIPTTRYRSPSWRVASPSVEPTPFNELSPAARPPQEFPGLFPCAPVALVPCPAPTPNVEPPAVRHVSFAAGKAKLRLATHDTSETQECPATGECPKAPSAVQSEWKRIPPHGHGAHDPSGPMFIAPFFPPPHPPHPPHPPQPLQPLHPPIPFDIRQTAYADPAEMIPPHHPPGPFPGAKEVRHVVSATYDVPHASAANLHTILQQGEGVLSCEVKGDELTVTAYPPYQAAIAQFLQAMDLKGQKAQMISKPIKAIGTEPAASKCGNGECQCKKCECCGKKDNGQAISSPVRAIDVDAPKSKCCNEDCQCKKCECKCECCGKKNGGQAISSPVRAIDVNATKSKCCNEDCQCKKCECKCECCCKKDNVTAVDPGEFSLAKSLAYHYHSLVNPQTAIPCRSNTECSAGEVSKPLTSTKPSCFSFYIGIDGRKPCSNANSECLAEVKGCPVLDAEILERYGTQLADAKQRLSAEEYDKGRLLLIERNLDGHIEKKFLAVSLLESLNQEQKAKLKESIDQQLAKIVLELQSDLDAGTESELEEKLKKQHTSLASLKTQVATHRMAMEALGLKQRAGEDKNNLRVEISATADGVLLKTSDGTQIRAKRIQLETDGIHQLKVEQSSPLSAKPEPKLKTKVETKRIDTSAVREPANADGFFQLAGPYSAKETPATAEKRYYFGIRR